MKKIFTTFLTHYAVVLVTTFFMGSLTRYNQVVMGATLLWITVGLALAVGVGYAMHLGVSYFANRSWKATAKRNQKQSDNITNKFYHN